MTVLFTRCFPRTTWPDAQGRFVLTGGRYVPETLMAPVAELEAAYVP